MATQASKIKAVVPQAAKKPSLARAEVVDKATRARLESELDAALKRKPASEAKLAGALRAVAPLSPALRASMAEAAQVMIRRESSARELYSSCLRAVAEADDRQATTLVKAALMSGDAGGSAALAAACFSRDASLAMPLAKLASSRQSHLSFGAETARVVRKESNGAHLTALAPMIKESHRISLCVELFVPLTRIPSPAPALIGPALAVLRGAERHLGRWLVLADVAVRAGDRSPLDEAISKATEGPSSARAAWSLVAWALAETQANGAGTSAPQTRPTVELVARLSDRPSADRDTTFLFRMARAKAVVAKPMLETLARPLPLGDEVAIRAALYLVRDHAKSDLRDALIEAAVTPKREELRGVAVAALWDAGLRDRARSLVDELLASRVIGNVAWGALVRAAASRSGPGRESDEPILTETHLRWIQWGWLE